MRNTEELLPGRRVKPDRKSEVGHGTVARSRGSRGRSQEVARDPARRSTVKSLLAPNHTQIKERNIKQRLPSKNHDMWETLENILNLRRVSGAGRLASLQRVSLFFGTARGVITIVSQTSVSLCASGGPCPPQATRIRVGAPFTEGAVSRFSFFLGSETQTTAYWDRQDVGLARHSLAAEPSRYFSVTLVRTGCSK